MFIQCVLELVVLAMKKVTCTTIIIFCPATGTEEDDEQNKKDEEKFERLLGQIKKFYGLWKPIGTELGIDVTAIERDYKGDSNRLQAVINQWPHSDKPSLKYKELLKACRSGGVSSAMGGTPDRNNYSYMCMIL